jgi:hypothetical protein
MTLLLFTDSKQCAWIPVTVDNRSRRPWSRTVDRNSSTLCSIVDGESCNGRFIFPIRESFETFQVSRCFTHLSCCCTFPCRLSPCSAQRPSCMRLTNILLAMLLVVLSLSSTVLAAEEVRADDASPHCFRVNVLVSVARVRSRRVGREKSKMTDPTTHPLAC